MVTAANAAVETICSDNFDGSVPANMQITYGTQGGGTITVSSNTSLNYDNSTGSLKGTYPANATGDNYIYAGCDNVAALATRELYVEFKAKKSAAYGVKFLKFFW